MHLVHPYSLIGDAPLPDVAIRVYAQVLCEDFAQRIGVVAPCVIVADGQLNYVTFDNILLCHSPINQWVRLTHTGDLVLASFTFNHLQLQFAIGHTLAHLIGDTLEWECDLAALEWMNNPAVPLVEPTTRAIAQISSWREQAQHFKCGERVVAIGDALMSEIWQTPLFQS
jgi:hypothetical protein